MALKRYFEGFLTSLYFRRCARTLEASARPMGQVRANSARRFATQESTPALSRTPAQHERSFCFVVFKCLQKVPETQTLNPKP